MGFHFLVLKFLIMILWFMICVISNHNHTNHTIILRTFHYYCYKALTLYIIIINKVLYYMGFHFLILKFLIMILWFVILWLQSFLPHCQPLCFSVLLLRRQGWGGGSPLSRIIDFWLSFCGTVDCEHLCRTCCSCTPKNVGFWRNRD